MKNFKKLFTLLLVGVLILPTFIFAGCIDGCFKKRYDVAIKVTDESGNEYIFDGQTDELRAEYQYTGNKIVFKYALNIVDHPQYGNSWTTSNIMTIHYTFISEDSSVTSFVVGGIKEKGTYDITIKIRENDIYENKSLEVNFFVIVK